MPPRQGQGCPTVTSRTESHRFRAPGSTPKVEISKRRNVEIRRSLGGCPSENLQTSNSSLRRSAMNRRALSTGLRSPRPSGPAFASARDPRTPIGELSTKIKTSKSQNVEIDAAAFDRPHGSRCPCRPVRCSGTATAAAPRAILRGRSRAEAGFEIGKLKNKE